jgi:hypothetical protein
MAHAFDTLIVEVDVSDFNFRRKTLSAHGATSLSPADFRRDVQTPA